MHYLASLQLASVRILKHYLVAFGSLRMSHSAPHRHGDNEQLQILQAWPGCNQTPQSLGHFLPPLERPPAERTAICLKYGRDSPLIHCSTSCVADYPKRPRGGISLPSLQCTTQGLLVLACADRFWDQPTFDAWQPSPRSIEEVGEWKETQTNYFFWFVGWEGS